MFLFLHRYFGKPAWGTVHEIPLKRTNYQEYMSMLEDNPGKLLYPNRVAEEEDVKEDPFINQYIRIQEMSAVDHRQAERLLTILAGLHRCFVPSNIDSAYPSRIDEYVNVSGNPEHPKTLAQAHNWTVNEILPGLQLDYGGDSVTVTFDRDRHIKLRDVIYEAVDAKHSDSIDAGNPNTKGFQSKKKLEEASERRSDNYWDRYHARRDLEAGRYGYYQKCLQDEWTHINQSIKRKENYRFRIGDMGWVH
jgi:hypothetical protein